VDAPLGIHPVCTDVFDGDNHGSYVVAIMCT